ncbi:hypothetical protein G5C60_29040 [Streptomyces sp. HC44]|uniref:Transposase n=1 Tax=Streptomyces scabichelini TaxID=2711217 RepID=A0A6G4VCK1_9ACTN|nr:hypothetical protein [Streptomyces scabichelini]
MPNRETGSVADWLQEHPGAEIVCRDHLMAFTKAIRQAAPDALEVADRRHLLWLPQRLLALTVCVNATGTSTNWSPRGCPSAPSAAACNWTARRYGATGTTTSKTSSPQQVTGAQVSSTPLPTTCRTGSSIRKGVAIPTLAVTPSPRTITSWIMRPQETLRASDSAQLETARNARPEIAAACDLAREFTDMVRHRQGHLLRDWIQKAELSGPEAIGTFAGSVPLGDCGPRTEQGLRCDRVAAKALLHTRCQMRETATSAMVEPPKTTVLRR